MKNNIFRFQPIKWRPKSKRKKWFEKSYKTTISNSLTMYKNEKRTEERVKE